MAPSVTANADRIRQIKTFPSLVKYLRDELNWPIVADDFEDLTYDWEPEELGIDKASAAKIDEVKQLRPLADDQPWGIFFVKFEPKQLPVVALRRLLNSMVIRKRESANKSERQAWAMNDLMFISSYGDSGERHISFAHFSQPEGKNDLPTLKVLGWDNSDTPLHLDLVASRLTACLAWPDDEGDVDGWRDTWQSAFSLRHRETITTAKDLAIRLAALARAIRDRIATTLAIETDKGPLTKLMKAFQSALMHDLDEAGFADMYAQTIAYGLLSARIADPKSRTADDLTTHMKTNPFLKELMQTFLHVGGRKGKAGGPGIDFDELGVSEVVELLDDANMEAVVRDFGDRNPQEDPVIHFYELFLKEYDAKKRMSRGVFYTPRPVVSYIVRSVDELLRTEFALADGLADTTTWGEMANRHKDLKIPDGVSPDQDFVQILDPATGTGTFLVEVIDVIHKSLVAKWRAQGHGEKKIDTLWNEYVPKHLLTRLHGYELLMAPYAIAHLKVGLKLYETGYHFGSDERSRVYLTNALESPSNKQMTLDFLPALAHEAEEVNEIKRKRRFSVLIGNPPYSGLSMNMGPWIDGLLKGQLPDGTTTASYYHVGSEPLGERKVWLQDDYVKFIRLSQWLLDTTGIGIHGFISNHGYLDNPTFRGMRWTLMAAFDFVYVLDLHGNLMKKEGPSDGAKDVNVFDIQQGVAIGLFIKKPRSRPDVRRAVVRHADLWGERAKKYAWLIQQNAGHTEWVAVEATEPFYLFEPFDQSEGGDYYDWPAIDKVMPINVTGVVTARDGFVIDLDETPLLKRIQIFLDTHRSDAEVREELALTENYAWRVKDARKQLQNAVAQKELREFVTPILYRPFDERLVFWHPSVVWRTRTEVMPHMLAGKNVGLIFMRQVAQGDTYSHFGVSRLPVDNRAFYSNKGIMSFAPLYLYPDIGRMGDSMFHTWPEGKSGRRPNLDPGFVKAIELTTGLSFHSDGLGEGSDSFCPEDVLSYIYAVSHSLEYRRRFEPMLKLDFPRFPPPAADELFLKLARLGGELTGLHLLESPKLAKPITEFIGSRNPEVEKATWSNNTVWVDKAQSIGFKGVPEEVWNFHIGGYQVCAKWLKDRKGRMLTKDDIAHYQKIVVALYETIRLMAEIDKVIDKHGGWPGAFQTGKAA